MPNTKELIDIRSMERNTVLANCSGMKVTQKAISFSNNGTDLFMN